MSSGSPPGLRRPPPAARVPFPRSSAGMMRGVHTFQTFARDMSIYLGRGQIMMTQQHLHDPQVGTVVEEVSRERVPQGMRRQAGLYTHRSRMALDQMPERLPGHSRAALGDE